MKSIWASTTLKMLLLSAMMGAAVALPASVASADGDRRGEYRGGYERDDDDDDDDDRKERFKRRAEFERERDKREAEDEREYYKRQAKQEKEWAKREKERRKELEKQEKHERKHGGSYRTNRYSPRRSTPRVTVRRRAGRSADLDRDGIPNSRDRDIDGDRVANGRDRYPYDRRRH